MRVLRFLNMRYNDGANSIVINHERFVLKDKYKTPEELGLIVEPAREEANMGNGEVD